MIQADIGDPLGLRDRAILETMYSTAMRRMEVQNLCLGDIDYEKGTVMIKRGKGGKARVVPIGDRALEWIEKYIKDVRPHLANERTDNTIFLNYKGERLNDMSISRLVSNYFKKSGIQKTGSCHVFRHTAATLMLENGADVRYIQEFLGHASLKSTQIYTRVSIRKLKEIHTKTHPAKMKSYDISKIKVKNPEKDQAD